MLLLGIDIGTSSIKVSVMDSVSQQCLASTSYPEIETAILSPQPGWAEQSPGMWWEHVQLAIQKLHAQRKYDPQGIAAIGIAYQMHGLVLVDRAQNVLRDSIIWCDSRAVEIGDKTFEQIGRDKCLSRLLNSPGNFTASKLAWVKENEPTIYARADKAMLPGDFIAMKMTGQVTTTISALSEGVFWDFQRDELSKDLFSHFQFNTSLIPDIKNVFEEHGRLLDSVANSLSLRKGIPVTYKAGDQPNNALSLNVLEPGEVAATAGTSGVIYGVTDQLTYDKASRINSFAHVNYSISRKRIGVLLCINGTGIMNRWVKDISGSGLSYQQINEAAKTIPTGSEGLVVFPFGNGAERMLNNRTVHAHIRNIDLNKHTAAHIYRAAQEGIANAFRYGLDIMKENGMNPSVIRAGKSNMFLSEVFTHAFVNTLGIPLELYNADGSVGAAIGAGIGAGIYADPKEAFHKFRRVTLVEPTDTGSFDEHYRSWLKELQQQLN